MTPNLTRILDEDGYGGGMGRKRVASTGLRPFWRYFGGKWRAAPRYPAPRYPTIVEPFAGAAGYSLRYPDRRVVLVEKYPVIAGIWRYLIATPSAEILRIPTVDNVDDLPAWVPQEARWLVGFCLHESVTSPGRRISAGCLHMRGLGRTSYGWCERHRERVAGQVDHIRHWRVIEGDYTTAPRTLASWFIDAPYQIAGYKYVHGSRAINYAHLASWCRTRSGQVIVCEADGAAWMPFRSFGETRGVSGKRSAEAVWLSDEAQLSLPMVAA
jgi:hypothetical protein